MNNTFTILKNGIAAKIHGGENSSNTFDMRFNEYPTNGQNISVKCFNNGFYNLYFGEQKLFVLDIFEEHWTSRYHYLGKPYHADKVSCVDEGCGITTVNTGGGAENNYDRVIYCTNAIMSPFTEIYSNSPRDHTIYVKTNGYNGTNLNSKINIQFGQITILFTEFDLITDTIFVYEHKNDVLRINLYFENSNFTISISNFKSEGRLGEIFFLNKYQQYMRFKFSESSEKSETEITTFERHAKCPEDLLNNLQNCIDQIKIPDRLKILSIFEVENSGKFIVGSKYNDVIAFDDKTTYAKGGEGSDIYIVGDNNVTIVNYAYDEKLDFLVMSKVPNSYSINEKNMLIPTHNGKLITIEFFFVSSENQHIAFKDNNDIIYIPLRNKNKIVQFIHATPNQNVFVLHQFKYDTEIVIDAKRADLQLFKKNSDLLIMRDETNPMVIEIKNYFLIANIHQNTQWYLYNNNQFVEFILEDALITDYDDKIKNDYLANFQEYQIDFKSTRLSINFNNDRRIGVLIFQNVLPNTIKVMQNNNSLVFHDTKSNNKIEIPNWDIYESHRISNVEFSDALETITINQIDRFKLNQISEMQNLFDVAANNYYLQSQFAPSTSIGVKFLITINGLINEISTFRCIGLNSIDQHKMFFNTYFDTEQLEALKKDANTEEIKAVLHTLKNSIILNGYNQFIVDFCNLQIDAVLTSEYLSLKLAKKKDTNELNAELFLTENYSNVTNISRLLYEGANVTAKSNDSFHRTLLHVAVLTGKLNVVQYVINQNVDVNAMDKNNETPLYYVIMKIQEMCKPNDFVYCSVQDMKNADQFLKIADFLCSKSAQIYFKHIYKVNIFPDLYQLEGEYPNLSQYAKNIILELVEG